MNHCPTCRRSFQPRGIPAKVIAGHIPPQRAPRIAAGWQAIQRTLDVYGQTSQQDLVAYLADKTGLAEKTLLAIIHAARQLDAVTVTYRTEGNPRRRRAWLALPEIGR